jgi:hypothetical protein
MPASMGLAVLALVVMATMVGCSGGSSPGGTVTAPVAQLGQQPTDDPLSAAAAQATAIIQRAQATALVLQAEAEATALVQRAGLSSTRSLPTSDVGADARPSPVAEPTSAAGPTRGTGIEVVGVGFAGEGAYIHVTFRAPVGIARRWQQGMISVTHEDTGTVYAAIPVMPKIGPLIGKPMREGQLGYVMLVNGPMPLKAGEQVTVVLGNYTEEHVLVGQ